MNKSCFFEIHPFESKCFTQSLLWIPVPRAAGLQDTYAYWETFMGLKSSLEYSNLAVERPGGKTGAVIPTLERRLYFKAVSLQDAHVNLH